MTRGIFVFTFHPWRDLPIITGILWTRLWTVSHIPCQVPQGRHFINRMLQLTGGGMLQLTGGGMEGWRDGGMEGWREGTATEATATEATEATEATATEATEATEATATEATATEATEATVAGTTEGFFSRKLKHTVNKVSSLRDLAGYVIDTRMLYSSP
ncbi:MAG: hypothetical protein LBK58_05985 [Prevotellaceae bacterium]|nr:hypothetical protein [Prevotellaceae bacterium]